MLKFLFFLRISCSYPLSYFSIDLQIFFIYYTNLLYHGKYFLSFYNLCFDLVYGALYTVEIIFKKLDFIFESNFRFIEKLRERCRNFQYTPYPYTHIAFLSIFPFKGVLLQSIKLYWYNIITQSLLVVYILWV